MNIFLIICTTKKWVFWVDLYKQFLNIIQMDNNIKLIKWLILNYFVELFIAHILIDIKVVRKNTESATASSKYSNEITAIKHLCMEFMYNNYMEFIHY